MFGGSSFNVMFYLVFFIIIVTLVINLGKNLIQWNKNNQSPRLNVRAKVVGKRVNVNHYHHANAGDASGAHGFHTSSSTRYYVTFEVESKDRLELEVNGSEYGMLIEQDEGMLCFQGTRYLSFTRD